MEFNLKLVQMLINLTHTYSTFFDKIINYNIIKECKCLPGTYDTFFFGVPYILDLSHKFYFHDLCYKYSIFTN